MLSLIRQKDNSRNEYDRVKMYKILYLCNMRDKLLPPGRFGRVLHVKFPKKESDGFTSRIFKKSLILESFFFSSMQIWRVT